MFLSWRLVSHDYDTDIRAEMGGNLRDDVRDSPIRAAERVAVVAGRGLAGELLGRRFAGRLRGVAAGDRRL